MLIFSWLDFSIVFLWVNFLNSYGYASTIVTIRASSLVNGILDWYEPLFGFLLGSHVGVFIGMQPRPPPSEVLLGRLLFKISWIGVSMILCVNFLLILVEYQVMDYVVH